MYSFLSTFQEDKKPIYYCRLLLVFKATIIWNKQLASFSCKRASKEYSLKQTTSNVLLWHGKSNNGTHVWLLRFYQCCWIPPLAHGKKYKDALILLDFGNF